MTSLMPYRYRSLINRPENSFFSDDFIKSFFFGNSNPSGFRVDVRDEGGHYMLEADLPGVKKENVKIDVEDGVLTIRCETNEVKDEEKKDYIFHERRYGRMQRSFTLSGIEENAISAEYKDGVLKLTLPKVAEEPKSTRQIAIN